MSKHAQNHQSEPTDSRRLAEIHHR